MKKAVLFFFSICLFIACDKAHDNEQPEVVKPLKLSTENYIWIDSLSYTFEITEGNGNYAASIAENSGDANITIKDNKVTVDLLSNSVSINISDKKGQSAHLTIYSQAKALEPCNYIISMDTASTYTLKNMDFGLGGYRVEKVKGTSAKVAVLSNDNLQISTFKSGNTYYDLYDKRGRKTSVKVIVIASYSLTSNLLEISATRDEVVHIALKWGEGGWKLLNDNPSSFFERISLMPLAYDKKYDILQLDIVDGNIGGVSIFDLKDKAGNIARIALKI